MNLSRCSRCVMRAYGYSLRQLSTDPVAKETIFDDEMMHMPPRQFTKKPPIDPFLKDLFLANFNRDVLAFPEVIKKDDMEALDARVAGIGSLLARKQTSADTDEALRNLRVTGAPASYFHGGLQATASERLRLMEAVAPGGRGRALRDRWLAIQILQDGLSERQQDEILPNIVNGVDGVSVCLRERPPCDPTEPDMSCTASRDIDGNYTIRGEKLTSATSPGHVLLVCQVSYQPHQMFYVAPGAKGVRVHDGHVTFNDTPATLLGKQDEDISVTSKAAQVLMKALTLGRLDTSAICIGQLREAIRLTLKAMLGKYSNNIPMVELELFRDRLALASLDLYRAEAAAYLSAGLLDSHEAYEGELEAAVTRLFSTRSAAHSLLSLMEASAGLADPGLQDALRRCYEDCRRLQMEDEQNDVLSTYVAMAGLQHSGLVLADLVRKMRNPVMHPGFMFSMVMRQRRNLRDDPSLILRLEEHLHPTLGSPATCLEYSVLRLQYATETLLRRHGQEVLQQHREIKRLTDVAIEVYTMTASIARASRAYCIGLANADREVELATMLCIKGKERVRALVLDVEAGDFRSGDSLLRRLAAETTRVKGYALEHPLTRVFW